MSNNEQWIKKYLAASLTRRDALKGALGTAGLALLAACVPSSSGSKSGPAGTITYLAAANFIGSWNPFDNLILIHMRAQRIVYDYLMWIDNSGNFVPGLATAFDNVGPTEWQVKLRQGVKFHDGQDFTAKDVKASVELASNPKSVTGALFPGQVTVEVVDDFTARIHTPTPFAALKYACLCANQSAAIISHVDADKGPDHLKSKMNGTGAFKWVSYKGEAGGLLMTANTSYWRGTPKVKDVVFKYVADTSARLAAVQAGQADIVESLGPDEARVLQGQSGVTLMHTDSTDSINVAFRTQTPPMDNAKLRQAISYAIDVPSIVDKIYGGYAKTMQTFGQPNTLYWQADPYYPKFDVTKAKALLAEAGYPGGAGLPELTFISNIGAYPKSKEFSEFIVQNLQNIGIKVKLQILDTSAWVDALFKPVGHMIMHGWLVPTPDRQAWLTSLFRSKGLISFFSDRAVDAAIRAQGEAIDPTQRAKIIHEQLEPLLVANMPEFPMFSYELITGVSNKVKDLLIPHWYEFDMFPVSKSS